ncbi:MULTISPECIES: family 43 glycosylhydrolase [Microbacterium]|uniref:Xylosidase/arabinosidase n=1 Tax=Microbacterium barkeri TaxID=33917 RepID=A0A9W6H2H5_9MICO|nr:family 43 glycosylhydrolase [Microbacterium barkeri]MDI6943287.1 family 43 glycosylhydrolase [Microbacterium barkeri]MDR6877384.1 beta-xylosidase [Microbacterium barkeri]GLJ61290.1 xylosidase/arabinosidase [Microbacterium barkeri]
MSASLQRTPADLGDGTFRNPILPGDRPDPSVLRVGDAYYLTCSSFDASPGLALWRSEDLVSWSFAGTALEHPLSTVFAPDLVEHGGRYFIYFPFIPSAWGDARIDDAQVWVVHADHPEGPWSAPVFTGISGAIDPGHVVGEDGERYLFVNGIRRCRLSADGLTAVTPLEQAYDGWQYPDEWITESYALEGPKFFRRGEWIYLVSAVGGTGGPATGHMVIVARSRSVLGPWENAPGNPIARTRSDDEAWWSRGHATILEGRDGRWWMVSHGYARRFRTLGRQALLEPIEWTEDGWPVAPAEDLGAPLPKPAPGRPHAVPAPSDDFAEPAWGERWVFDDPGRDELDRVRFDGGLVLRGKGASPADASPLTTWAMDRAFEIEVEIEVPDGTEAGLLLWFNRRMFYGMSWDGRTLASYAGGIRTHRREQVEPGSIIQLRLVDDQHIVTGWFRRPGEEWSRHGVRYDVEGAHSATLQDLKSLRPALFAAGDGAATFRGFRYRVREAS